VDTDSRDQIYTAVLKVKKFGKCHYIGSLFYLTNIAGHFLTLVERAYGRATQRLRLKEVSRKGAKDIFFPPMVQQPLVGQGLLIIEASGSHSDTPHSVGLLRTRDQPDAETST
jgi:hypothetical protein